MNIFFLSLDPKEAAEALGDKHVIKMILESTQLLFTCAWIINPVWASNCPFKIYKKTHEHHPSTKWLCEKQANFLWLCDTALAMCEEKLERWPNSPAHACHETLKWMSKNPIPALYFKIKNADNTITVPASVVPDNLKPMENTVEAVIDAYKEYYKEKYKSGIVKYKILHKKPDWIK